MFKQRFACEVFIAEFRIREFPTLEYGICFLFFIGCVTFYLLTLTLWSGAYVKRSQYTLFKMYILYKNDVPFSDLQYVFT